jgi:hypothetical protein
MSLLTQASLVVTPNANKTGKLYSVIPSNGNGDFTVTRATTATRTNSSGLIETTASGMVRRDYSLGSCPNLLLEPQRTNNSRSSEDLTNAVWAKNSGVTITADNTISPSGVQNADRVSGATGAAIWAMPNTLSQSISSLPSSTLYTITIYLRSSTTSSQVTLVLRDQSTGSLNQIVCNLTSSWQRFEISRTTGALTTALGVVLGAATADFFAWGLQAEAGAYATSYIPTTTASVTRNADQISLGNVYTNGLISASGGTWFVEFRNNLARVRDAGSYSLLLGDSTVALPNAFTIRSATAGVSSRLIIAKIVATVETNLYTTLTDTVKIAIKWNGTTADVFVNGTKVVSSTAYTPTTMQFIYANGNDIPKNINQMALFPTALTDAQCTQLTTL